MGELYIPTLGLFQLSKQIKCNCVKRESLSGPTQEFSIISLILRFTCLYVFPIRSYNVSQNIRHSTAILKRFLQN